MLSILLRLARGAASLSAADDGVPGSRIEKVEKGPKDHDGEEPVACALQALPHFGKVELAYHDGKDHQAKDEEDVLVLLFHVSTRSFTLPWVRAFWEWRSVPSRSRLSSPCRVWGADGHPPGRRRRGCGKCRWP